MNITRPPLESSQKGASNGGVSIFISSFFCGVVLCNILNNKPSKLDKTPVDASRRDLSDIGLGLDPP